MIEALIMFVIYAIVVGIVAWILQYVVGMIPMPEPLGQIVRVGITVIACLIVLLLLLRILLPAINLPGG